MGKRELVALLNLSPWCLVMVEWLYLAVLYGCLLFVIVVFPDHTHLLLLVQSVRRPSVHSLDHPLGTITQYIVVRFVAYMV